MNMKQFPVIDPIATGKNIIRLRVERGMSVRDLQAYFGFEEPQAIYKWQLASIYGRTAPTITDTAESQDRLDHFCQGHALAGSLRSEGSMPQRINGSKASNIKIGILSISNRIGRCEVARLGFGVSVFTISCNSVER